MPPGKSVEGFLVGRYLAGSVQKERPEAGGWTGGSASRKVCIEQERKLNAVNEGQVEEGLD